mmetsp:Transcript_168769/g.542418  ORF Transcript_168769/g.542418 Transcript_168769/m.542418 type:complete len:231 (+) Transcript_168769:874-1566(+)
MSLTCVSMGKPCWPTTYVSPSTRRSEAHTASSSPFSASVSTKRESALMALSSVSTAPWFAPKPCAWPWCWPRSWPCGAGTHAAPPGNATSSLWARSSCSKCAYLQFTPSLQLPKRLNEHIAVLKKLPVALNSLALCACAHMGSSQRPLAAMVRHIAVCVRSGALTSMASPWAKLQTLRMQQPLRQKLQIFVLWNCESKRCSHSPGGGPPAASKVALPGEARRAAAAGAGC